MELLNTTDVTFTADAVDNFKAAAKAIRAYVMAARVFYANPPRPKSGREAKAAALEAVNALIDAMEAGRAAPDGGNGPYFSDSTLDALVSLANALEPDSGIPLEAKGDRESVIALMEEAF